MVLSFDKLIYFTKYVKSELKYIIVYVWNFMIYECIH